MSETGEKKSLVPKLRFPSFTNQAWDIGKFGHWFYESTAADVGHLPLLSVMDELGVVPQAMSGRKSTASQDRSRYLHVRPNDIVYNTMRMWEGRSALSTLEGAVSPAYTICRPLERTDPVFFSHYLKTAQMIDQFHRYSQGLVKDTLNLKFDQFALIPVAVPSMPEQRKIAEFLQSLDELIAAETEKLEALKRHKKGLLQQLFPAEGETTPRLRFPQFRNSGEWITKTLNEISPAIFDGTHQTPTYVDEGVPFYSVENLISGRANKFISVEDYDIATKRNKPEKGDVLITRIGNIGYAVHVDWDFAFSIYVTLAVIKSSPSFTSKYLASYLQSDTYQKEIQSVSLLTAVPCKVNMEALRRTSIKLPQLPEQVCLAKVFDDLDRAIIGDSDYIASLLNHKAALMQQLFPSLDELDAPTA